jgi:GNAT superfamily N-acetyltransferase
VNLREAGAADIGAIARLHAESWRVAYRGMYRDEFLDGPVFGDRLSVWRGRLTSPATNQHTIVAEDGSGAIAGFACAFGDDDPQWGTLLDNIHVDPVRKRAGIGTRLLGEVGRLVSRHYPSSGLYLWVLEGNVSARRFYERWGAQNAGAQEFEPAGGGKVTSLRYVWPDLTTLRASGRKTPEGGAR